MKLFVVSLSLLIAACGLALAQTSSPAQIGITHSTTPEQLNVIDKAGNRVPWGSLNGSSFTPSGLGAVMATSVGMIGNGATDNAPFIQAFNNAVMPTGTPVAQGGSKATFPAIAGQKFSPYFFSKALKIGRGGSWDCNGYSGPRQLSGAVLVFAAGIDGVRLEDSDTSLDGGSAQSATIENCAIVSLGRGLLANGFQKGVATLIPTMDSIGLSTSPGYVAPSSWSPGDAFILWGGINRTYTVASNTVTAGAFSGTGSIASGVLTITVATSGSLPVGAPIFGLGIPISPFIYITSQLSGTPGGIGTYQLNITPADVGSRAINSSYGVLTIPGGTITAATASWSLGATSVSITHGACATVGVGEFLYDVDPGVTNQLPTHVGTVSSCVVGGGASPDTVTISAAAVASVGSTDALRFSWISNQGTIMNNLVPGSSWTATNSVPATSVLGQNSTNEPDSALGGGGVYTLSYQQANITATTSSGSNQEWAPATPPGSYVDSVTGSAPTQTLVVHAGFEPTLTNPNNTGTIWQLPAIQAYTVTTVAGSATLTVTAGPTADPSRLLYPGDFIDSAPFDYGCLVNRESGSAGAQSITLGPPTGTNTSTGPVPVCLAKSSGSFSLWEVPSALRMVPQSTVRQIYARGFPFGVNFYSQSSSLPALNATGSWIENTTVEAAIIGIMEGGNDTSGSLFLRNEGIANFYADFATLSTLGNPHVGENSNSVESGQAVHTVLAFCGSQNASVFVGGYFGAGGAPVCIGNDGQIFRLPMAQPGTITFMNPAVATPGAAAVMGKSGVSNASFSLAPTTTGAGIWFFTQSQYGQPQSLAPLYNMIMGTAGNATVNALGWNYNPATDCWQTNTLNNTTFNTAIDNWCIGSNGVANGAYAAGAVVASFHTFPVGFGIGTGAANPGNERKFDFNSSAPTNTASTSVTAAQAFLSTNSLIAVSTVTGVTANSSVTDTTVGPTQVLGTIKSSNITQNWLTLTALSTHASAGKNNTLLFNGAGPIATSDWYGTTQTLIPLASCAGVSAGQTVTDQTDSGAAVGTVSACGTGQATMVLYNTAGAGHASSGVTDALAIAVRRQGDFRFNSLPAAGGSGCWVVVDNAGTVVPGCPLASDATGKAWPEASVKSTISTLPTCAGNIVGAVAIITNGIASPTYLQAVSTTGTSTRRVFCDTTGWLYD